MKNNIDILFIQPYDRPWIEKKMTMNRLQMPISRAQFEIAYQIDTKYSIAILDLNLSVKSGFKISDAINEILEFKQPKIIMISFPTLTQGRQISRIIRTCKHYGDMSIILGGSAISIVKNAPLKWWHGVDCCYDGFGNRVNRLIASVIARNNEDIPGVYWRRSIPTVASDYEFIIDNYSAVDFYTCRGRFDFKEYINKIRELGMEPIGLLELTRGCRFECDFCSLNKKNLGFFSRSPNVVLDEAYYLAGFGINSIQLIDPSFGLDKDKALKLLDGLSELRKKFPKFGTDILMRADMVENSLVNKMPSAGIKSIAIGMESMDEDDLIKHSKKINTESIRNSLEIISRNKIEIKLFNILFPNEKISIKTVKFLIDLTDKKISFIVQSSFLRSFPKDSKNVDFLSQDRTVYRSEQDNVYQLMNYMLINLTFNSMDFGGDNADSDLMRLVKQSLTDNDLLKLFIKTGSKLILGNTETNYVFNQKNNYPVYSCIKKGG